MGLLGYGSPDETVQPILRHIISIDSTIMTSAPDVAQTCKAAVFRACVNYCGNRDNCLAGDLGRAGGASSAQTQTVATPVVEKIECYLDFFRCLP